MKGIKFFIGFLILFFCFALQNVFGFSPNQNYLLGMTVTRVGSGGYFVRIKLNEDTDTQYKLKNLGENSYVLVLPHMRTKITGEDVFYENDDENIKVVISETQNHINHEDYYTKINFKTKNDTSIKIEYFARKYSKPPVVMDTTNNDIIKSAHETTIPEWFWFLPIGILCNFVFSTSSFLLISTTLCSLIFLKTFINSNL